MLEDTGALITNIQTQESKIPKECLIFWEHPLNFLPCPLQMWAHPVYEDYSLSVLLYHCLTHLTILL